MFLPKPSTFTEQLRSAFKEAMPQKLTLDEFKKRSVQVTERLGSAIKGGVPRELSVRQLKKSVRAAALIILIMPGSFTVLEMAGVYLANRFRQSDSAAQDQANLQKDQPKEKLIKELEAILPKLLNAPAAYGKWIEGLEANLEGQKVKIDIQFNKVGDLILAPFRILSAEGNKLMCKGTLRLRPAQDGFSLAQE